MIPALRRHGRPYNTALFSEQAIDDEMDEIGTTVPIDEQPDAWGALDEKIDDRVLSRSSRPLSAAIFAFGEDRWLRQRHLGGRRAQLQGICVK